MLEDNIGSETVRILYTLAPHQVDRRIVPDRLILTLVALSVHQTQLKSSAPAKRSSESFKFEIQLDE